MTQDPTPPTRQSVAAKDRSDRLTVSGRLKQALMFMVWEGKTRKEAATAAGMSDHGLREALRKPHVRVFYSMELEVLRTSARAKNFHRLDEIAASSGNDMARVGAIKAMEALAAEAPPPGSATPLSPGLVIVIQNGPAPATVIEPPVQTIDVTPSHDPQSCE